jgi:hypothetical protein
LRLRFGALRDSVGQYACAAWTFNYCDQAMNGLFGLMTEVQIIPDYAFAVFFAFCADELPLEGGAPQAVSAHDLYTLPPVATTEPDSDRKPKLACAQRVPTGDKS